MEKGRGVCVESVIDLKGMVDLGDDGRLGRRPVVVGQWCGQVDV